jgi:hypothetical protein
MAVTASGGFLHITSWWIVYNETPGFMTSFLLPLYDTIQEAFKNCLINDTTFFRPFYSRVTVPLFVDTNTPATIFIKESTYMSWWYTCDTMVHKFSCRRFCSQHIKRYNQSMGGGGGVRRDIWGGGDNLRYLVSLIYLYNIQCNTPVYQSARVHSYTLHAAE